MASQIWLITGASRGLGLAIAPAVLEKGDGLIAAVQTRNTPRKLSETRSAFLWLRWT